MIAAFCCPCIDIEGFYRTHDYGTASITHINKTTIDGNFHAGGTLNPVIFHHHYGDTCPHRFLGNTQYVTSLGKNYWIGSNPDTWDENLSGWLDNNRSIDFSVSSEYNNIMTDVLMRIPTFNYYDSLTTYVGFEYQDGVNKPMMLQPLDEVPSNNSYFEINFIGSELMSFSGSDIDSSIPAYEEFISEENDNCGKLVFDIVRFLHYHWIKINYKCTFHEYIPAKKYSCCEIIDQGLQ